MSRRRLDAEMVRRGLVADRAEAAEAVRAGLVTVAGSIATKVAALVDGDVAVRIEPEPNSFVSRAGEKLRAALDRFGVDPAARDCLDAGAATGGFTDCLLQRRAARVIAVDVGYGLLDWRLRNDPRVTVLERTNVRELESDAMAFPPSLVVTDLSFISLRTALPSLARVAVDDAEFVMLVKPQFEAPAREVEAGGVVRDPTMWRRVLSEVGSACVASGLAPVQVMASPIRGRAGNIEFLLHAQCNANGSRLHIDAAIAEASAMRP